MENGSLNYNDVKKLFVVLLLKVDHHLLTAQATRANAFLMFGIL